MGALKTKEAEETKPDIRFNPIPLKPIITTTPDTLKSIPSKISIPRYEYIGYQRIIIEGEVQLSKEETQKYANQYADLVDSVSGILKEQGIAPKDETGFITSLLGTIGSNLKVVRGSSDTVFLHASLETNRWSPDNISSLIFDVGKNLGIAVKMVILPGRAVAATSNFFFEPMSRQFNPLEYLNGACPTAYGMTSDIEKILAFAHINSGNAYYDLNQFDKAIQSYSKAIKSNPECAEAYYNRGLAHLSLGMKKEADVDMAKYKELAKQRK